MTVTELVNIVDSVRSDVRELIIKELKSNSSCALLRFTAAELPSTKKVLAEYYLGADEAAAKLRRLLMSELMGYVGAALTSEPARTVGTVGSIPYKQHFFVEPASSNAVAVEITVVLYRHGMFAAIVAEIARKIRATLDQADVDDLRTVSLPYLQVYTAYKRSAAVKSANRQGRLQAAEMVRRDRIWVDPDDHGQPYVFVCKRIG